MNVGFYNIVVGLALLVGVVILNIGNPVAGRTLIFMVCATHVILGTALAVVEPKMWRTAVLEGALPLLVILVALLL